MFRFAASALLYSFSAYNFFKLGLDFLAGFQQRRILRCYRCMFFNLRLEMEAYLRYEKTFGRIVSGCPAAEWEDDEYDPDEV